LNIDEHVAEELEDGKEAGSGVLNEKDIFQKAQGPLSSLAQCILVQFCSWVASGQSAASDLTGYEVLAYARSVCDFCLDTFF